MLLFSLIEDSIVEVELAGDALLQGHYFSFSQYGFISND